MQRWPMRKIREAFRLKAARLTQREIAASLGVGRTTVGEYLDRAARAGLSWPLPDEMDDPALEVFEHRRALKALGMVNRLSLTSGRIWREVRRLVRAGRAHRSLGRGVADPLSVAREGEESRLPPLRLLDVACGTGLHIQNLKNLYQVQGVDHSPGMLDVARQRYDMVNLKLDKTGGLTEALALAAAARHYALEVKGDSMIDASRVTSPDRSGYPPRPTVMFSGSASMQRCIALANFGLMSGT